MTPHWWLSWWDAHHEAVFRAGIAGRRYRVRRDDTGWRVTETTAPQRRQEVV